MQCGPRSGVLASALRYRQPVQCPERQAARGRAH
jgi:hypothetical protein